MSHRKRVILALKILVVVLVAWGIYREVVKALDQVKDHAFELDYGWLTVAGVLYLASMLPAAMFWRRMMNAMGQDAWVGETLRAYYIGVLGKYVPGKALVVVLRAGLMRSHRVETAVAAISVFFETLSMMAVGSLIAALILGIWIQDHWKYVIIGLFFMLVVGVPTLPPVFKRLIKVIAIGKRYPNTAEKISRVTYGTLLGGWLGLALAWVLMGASMWATVRAMGAVEASSLSDLPLYIACVALAVVGGFISQIPGGFGVREFILMTMLAPVVGDAVAVGATVLLRLVSLVAEVAISVILIPAGRRRPTLADGEAAVAEPAESAMA